MYLTAQRVISPQTHEMGVNTYKYIHWTDWAGAVPEEFLPDTNPGERGQQFVEVLPPGNRVLSFLDVVLTDSSDPQSVRDLLLSLKWALPAEPLPAVRRLGNAWVRFNMAALGIPAKTELAALAGHLVFRFYSLL